MEPSDALHDFRRSLYECLHRRGNALFELAEAILSTDAAAPSPVHLSLQAAHRRGWGSFYAALARGRIDAEALRDLLICHPLAGSDSRLRRGHERLAPMRRGVQPLTRAYYYHPSRHSAGQPIVAGWAYQFVAQLRLARACVADLRLPWERRYESARLRPMRVHRAVSALLAHVGTPAEPPKPCGRSPGRPKGRLSGRAERYPALKKEHLSVRRERPRGVLGRSKAHPKTPRG